MALKWIDAFGALPMNFAPIPYAFIGLFRRLPCPIPLYPSTRPRPITVLCLASYFKGAEFLEECKRQGCRTLLLTSQSLGDADWPRASLDNIFYVPDEDKTWKLQDVLLGISHLAKTEVIDRVVPLDDFDVETAATLREHLRVPGMGDSTARYFRDKLAMRTKARDEGLPVPEFIQVLNHRKLNEFLQRVPAPWVLKPRSLAGSIGVKRSPARTNSGQQSIAWATSSRSIFWNNMYRATFSTSTPLPTRRSCCSRLPANTDVLRWTSRTKGIFSRLEPWRKARPTKSLCAR